MEQQDISNGFMSWQHRLDVSSCVKRNVKCVSNEEMSNVQNFSSLKIMLTLLINNYTNDDKSDSDEKLFTPCPLLH